MHPRNIYKNPPNFKELAESFEEFRQYVHLDISGKVKFDFKNLDALRVLAKTLLLKDFNLTVNIPKDSLVPTLPLRLNYILWLEDLLKLSNTKNEDVFGIDIGTGATCIYPLLSSRKGWKMLATEIDESSCKSALENVKINQLEDFITVKKVDQSETIFKEIDKDIVYDFCMCNPPFFSDKNELDFTKKSRTLDRKEPSNAQSGKLNEITTIGGEENFIKKIMEESEVLKTNIKIFTTMIGKKSTFVKLKHAIQYFKPKSTTFTEFSQGKTTRWALAWTYCDFDLNQNSVIIERRKRLKNKPFIHLVPEDFIAKYRFSGFVKKMLETLEELKMNVVLQVDNISHKAYHVTATENTWSNQRKRRREALLLKKSERSNETKEPPTKQIKSKEEINGTKIDISLNKGETTSKQVKMTCSHGVEFLLVLRVLEVGVLLEMTWLAGGLGKDAVHQVLQYFKNVLSQR